MSTEQRKLLSIVFTDIKGYTAIMEQDEEKGLRFVSRFEKTVSEVCAKHHGRVIQFMGDGALVVFENSINAIDFGIEVQGEFLKGEVIPHRVGIHTGEAILKNGNVYGDSVNVASRIESIGVSGSVLISGMTYQLIKNKERFQTKSMGSFHFKNQSSPIKVYAIAGHNLVVPERKELKGKTKAKDYRIHWTGAVLALAIIIGLLSWQLSLSPLNTIAPQDEWNGIWHSNVEVVGGQMRKGMVTFQMVDSLRTGTAQINYNPKEDVSLDLQFQNINLSSDSRTLKGNWSSDLSEMDVEKGYFEFSLDSNNKSFSGTYSTMHNPQKFQWSGQKQ